MSYKHLIVWIIIIIGIMFFLKRAKAFNFPPHEFAYGAQLLNIGELPKRVEEFLALECLDQSKIRLEVSVIKKALMDKIISKGDVYFEKGGIDLLIKYLSNNISKNIDINPLISSLWEIEKIDSPLQRSIKLLNTLIEYKDILKNEAKQDDIIIFIYYRFKNPSLLDAITKNKVAMSVNKLDTIEQWRVFTSENCPDNFLEGNINIYPLLIENTSWYRSGNIKTTNNSLPILEIRFMGLKGIFEYLLEEMGNKYNVSFFHLDGEYYK